MADRKPTFHGRQLLGHLQASLRPCLLIDHRKVVVFANEAAAALLGIPTDLLEGYELVAKSEEPSTVLERQAIVSLLSWAEGSRVFEGGGCELVHCKAGDREWHWLALAMDDDKQRRLVSLVAVFDQESLIRSFRPTHEWQIDQVTRDYLNSLSSRQYSLRKLLQLSGPSSATKLALQQTQLATESRMPVLISGKAGTGKRQLAAAILHHRGRAHKVSDPPTILNCQLLDDALLRELSDLLQDRSSTAKQNKERPPGILLDRIDLLNEACLKDLLGLIGKCSDCDVVATIDEDFDLAQSSTTRKLLVDAVRVISIRLPAFRDRALDQPLLLRQVLTELSQQRQWASIPTVSEEAMQMISVYAWPGNLSEFVRAMEFAAKQSDGRELQAAHMPLALRSFPSSILEQTEEPLNLELFLEQTEREIIERALQRYPRSRAQAAKMLGISRTKLLRRIEYLQINATLELEQSKPEVAPTTSSDKPISPRRRKLLSDQELIELTSEEISEEMPIFREIEED